MAAIERKSVQFSLPPLTPSFYNSHALLPAEASQSIRPINSGAQKVTPYNRPNLVRKGDG
jgi:hypothetical protein